MKNLEVIKHLEKNPDSEFTLSVSDGVSQGFANKVVEITDNGDTTTVVGDLDELNFFHTSSKNRIVQIIKSTTISFMLNDQQVNSLAQNIVDGLYIDGGIKLTPEDAEILSNTLNNPPEPNEKLKKANKKYQKFVK